jgi:hypothetical protein
LKRTITYSFIFIVLCLVALWIAYADIVAGTFLEDDKLQYSAEADREIARCDALGFSWNADERFCDRPEFFKSVDLYKWPYAPLNSSSAIKRFSDKQDIWGIYIALDNDGADTNKLKTCLGHVTSGNYEGDMRGLGWCIRYFYKDRADIIETYRAWITHQGYGGQ